MAYLFLLAASPFLMFFIHMLTGRFYMKMNLNSSPLISAVWAIAVSFLLIGFTGWKIMRADFVAMIYGALVFAFLAGSYYILFAMTEAARRIKILQEIYHKGEISVAELNRDYGPAQLFSIRLERLVALGQLEKRDGRFYLKGRLLYCVGVFVSLWGKLLKF